MGDQGAAAAAALLQALVPALLMNICIVGLNQLYDVEIDRVNKPYLPLASGELSERQGRWVVGVSGGLRPAERQAAVIDLNPLEDSPERSCD